MNAIYILRYAAQENNNYLAGFLSAYSNLDKAAKALAEQMDDMRKQGWHQIKGLDAKDLANPPHQYGKLWLYDVEFIHKSTLRKMNLYISKINVE